MTQKSRSLLVSLVSWWFTIVFTFLSIALSPASAQSEDCGVVQRIDYPIDRNTFTLVQDYAAPSSRHQGRFHTGEDWFGGVSGLPVQAIAPGRVTYSAANGWGRDGGVVILEHTFPDGSIAYSQYGHMMESEQVKFPPKFKCVLAGEVVGLVGDARPAPHVHFEIRVNQPDTAGPGYTREDPDSLGWRRPMQFVTNWQTWLTPAHYWHIELPRLKAPPLELNDHSLMYLDRDTLKLATYDGRVLWRIFLEKEAVSVTGYQGTSILAFNDGTMQVVNYDGSLDAVWSVDAAFDSPPLDLGNGLLFHTSDDALVALSENRREITWRLDDVPSITHGHVTGQTIGLVTTNDELLTISRDGRLLDRAQYRGGAQLSTFPDTGALLSYSRGGLWAVDETGKWAFPFAWADTLPGGDESGAALVDGVEHVYLFDGTTVYAYGRDSALLWSADLPGVEGMTELAKYGSNLLLVSAGGDIAAVSENGTVCNHAKIYSDGRSPVWHSLGDDGVLRVALSGQMLGLGWETFTRGCG